MKRKEAAVVFSILLASTFLLAIVMAPAPAQAASWTQASTGGGIDGNFNQMQTTASSMAVYGPLLYIGTEDITNGCDLHILVSKKRSDMTCPHFSHANAPQYNSITRNDFTISAKNRCRNYLWKTQCAYSTGACG